MANAGGGDDAGRTAALAEADARGVTVPEGERAELVREWEDRVYRWSASLGFRYGMTPATVAETAFAALSDPSQGTRLVIEEISEHRHLLDARYDIQVANDPSGN